MSVIICMATYNGDRWLQEQIDSVIAQSYEGWQLLISDDGSSDATLEIIHDNVRRDSRMRFLDQRKGGRGAVGNFEYLLSEAARVSAEWVALCDQDDVWHPEKLSLQRQQLQNFRACCSDLMLTNAKGEATEVRFLQQLDSPLQPSVSSLLAHNSVVGCTLAVTAEVLDLALPFPPGLRNHDWWLALCALCEGPLFCDSQTLVNYRQHDSNVVGAYDPLRQLVHAPELFLRQRGVLSSQLVAVRVLIERLLHRQINPPQVLENYLLQVGSDSLKKRFAALAFGEFAAPHRPLRALRMAAALKKLD
ncbi:MAG: glycosyltransferase involved in cell wall biosynthesis [Glaciecola sp.]|jgi:glycosyltransferase involved in cell wall biosynthesis|uniref:glycosyltransferase family 2 protein n=1 Tax=Congregibacter sp. TaxID=2744308 RepID=UPI0039E48922